ncbi:helix-turn-helix domain-containing protein [Ruminococcus albus]|uniref:AraC family transcriptional regulator, arabinose operon regulatory protein n=1 Tax=Ruminococcus albus TaxID=1264 RepID=A0A1H7KT39_RUMAL|nr:AraC family transcriptional regulator [Ruminococcus albus]SEK89676.1 AraC family transcriptional regulator, arabinose operon regulatory protein [Ruminococcus albus]
MRITNVGCNHWHDADFFIDRPEGSGDLLLLLLKTSAVFVTEKGEHTAEAGSFMLYKLGTPQCYRADGGRYGNDWFHFLPESIEDEQFLKELDIPFDTPVRIDSLSELTVFISMMCHEHYSGGIYSTDTCDLLVKLFFLKLSDKLHRTVERGMGSGYEDMSVLRAKIYNDPARKWNIEELAHEMTMSRSSFQHGYKKLFGVTPMTDVIAARTERAEYLLSSTSHSVSRIAQMCGYSSDIHFVRQFRKVKGESPTEYRTRVKNKRQNDK